MGKRGFIQTKRMNKMRSVEGLIIRRCIPSFIKNRFFTVSLILILSLFAFSSLVEAQSWPASGSWISLGTDQNEDGTSDDFRDVQNIYYYTDSSYLYLRLCCRDFPTFTKTNPDQEARYKWFIDLDGNSYISGGNAVEAEYLLFSEDTNDVLPGEVYLLNDTNGDGNFNEWHGNYSGGLVTNPAVAAYRIQSTCFDQYIAWSSIGNPANVWLIWTTDQENPNLDQSPDADNPDADAGVPIGPISPSYCTDNDADTYAVQGGACGPIDCNDNDAAIYPGATEICDGKNNDCNAGTADGSGEAWYGTACDGPDTDLCKEGVYGCTGGAQSCSDTTGNTVEVCNDSLDNDCDGATDCADTDCAAACQTVSYYCDNDSDGYKDASVDGTCTGIGCQPAGCQTTAGNDCNDTDSAIHTGATEICDGKNNDCDAGTADGSEESWYETTTSCGIGACASTGQLTCSGGAQTDSCTPGTPQTEIPNNGIDEDCDGFDLSDIDLDGIPDGADNCPKVANGPAQAGIPGVGNQTDGDGDGLGGACDYQNNTEETLSIPYPTINEGEPLWVTATLYFAGPNAIQTIRPDCFNTTFTVRDVLGNILPPRDRIRKAYGICDDVITVNAGDTITVTCDLTEMYDPAVLTGGTYTVKATYSNYIQDPDLNPVTRACAQSPCCDLWMGSVSSDGVSATITISDPDGDNVPYDNCPTVYNPDQSDTDHDGIGDVCDILTTEITLLVPNGGDILPSGEPAKYAICWKAPSNAVKFDLEYSINNGTSWNFIKSVTGFNCIHWEIPVVTANKKTCLVQVIGYDSNGVLVGGDISDKPFTIEVAGITSPNGRETLKSGNTQTIKWRTYTTIRPVTKTVLKYTINAGTTWNAIKTLTGNPGGYNWSVPSVLSTKTRCKVKVILKDASGVNVGSDVSDRVFTIQP